MGAINLESVRARMAEALRRAGRPADDATLVVVTKGVDVPRIEEAIASGARDIGENRVQEAVSKYNSIGEKAVWHLIGHLQTNKVRQAVKIFSLIQSVDSLDIAKAIDRESAKLGKVQEVLVEVNISGEPQKYGVAAEGAARLVEEAAKLPSIRVLGLMGMAPLAANGESSRPYFTRLKEAFDGIKERGIAGAQMKYLSMGMSQDFEAAIEEGSNMVRIGSAIFK